MTYPLLLSKNAWPEVVKRWSESHPGLAFNKFARWNRPKNEMKRAFLKEFANTFFPEKSPATKSPAQELFDSFILRRNMHFETLISEGYSVVPQSLTTDWRFVSGLGMSHPFETGFVFDHTYGVPYLPGSSVKGAARSWAKMQWPVPEIEAIFGPEDHHKKDAEGQAVFSPAQGGAIFFDAYSEKWPKLDLDIINVHYKDYYEGKTKTPPADWLSPEPIYFLALAKGQSLKFVVAVKPDVSQKILKNAGVTTPNCLANKALKAVIGAAKELGMGGKTAVGYGYFK